jgi:diguanylate cyclase (GGDEF)-like protein
MGSTNGQPAETSAEHGVRLASIPAGVRVTLIVCAAAGVDVTFYADPSRRVALGTVLAIAAIGALATGRLPWHRIVHSRWREPAFLAWSLSNVATISVFGFINNTPNSALALLFLVPIVFVSMTYPVRSVVIVGVASALAYLAVACHAGSSPDYVLMFISVLGSTALMGAWQARNQDGVRAELARMSRTDPLTGCLNRRGFEERAEDAIKGAAASDYANPLAVVLVDLDAFKQVNDTGGHAAGDQVLRDVATKLASVARHGDVIGRLGGDEFAVLLHGVDEEGAAAAAQRLENALQDVIRASIGVAVLPRHGTALDALIGWADRRLYETKLRHRAEHARSAAMTLAELELNLPPTGSAIS